MQHLLLFSMLAVKTAAMFLVISGFYNNNIQMMIVLELINP